MSMLLTRAFIYLAHRYQIYDMPGHRKIHANPMPRLGGVAIYLSFLAVILLNLLGLYLMRERFAWPQELYEHVEHFLLARGGLAFKRALGLLLGSTFIFSLGLLDDLRGLSVRKKLLGQVVGAMIILPFGIKLDLFISNDVLSGLVTVGWVVFITNAFNLLDNMDGLSAGVAVIASLLFFFVVLPLGKNFTGVTLLAFAGSLLGFLRYNFYPARVFMGDSGSMFIGYTLSVLTVLSTFYTIESPTLWPVVMPLLILSVPIFDTLGVIYLRWRQRVSIFEGDTRHISHRLVQLGMSQRAAVCFIYLVALCIGLGSYLLRQLEPKGIVVIFLQTIGIFTIIVLLMMQASRRTREGG